MATFSTTLEREIRSIVGERCFFDKAVLAQYASDRCWYSVSPLGLVQPKHSGDVVEVVRYCYNHEIPLIPRGAATGLAGQAIGMGLILDFTKYMTRILNISDDGVTVQPGVVLDSLNAALKPQGKFFPIDPASTSQCTIGGMIGTNAAGAHGVRHGAMKDHVRSLTVVLSNGEQTLIRKPEEPVDPAISPFHARIVQTLSAPLQSKKELIRRAFPNVPKNSSGYNLKDAVASAFTDFRKLIVGSEGTLAVVVEADLAIAPIPPMRLGALLYLKTYDQAVEATMSALDLAPAAVEILDRTYFTLAASFDAAVDRLLTVDASVMLYVEFEGMVLEDLQKSIIHLGKSAALIPAVQYLPLTRPSEQEAFWRLRQEASKAINSEKFQNKTSFIEDVCVPVKHLPKYVKGLKELLDRNGIRFSLYGHAATGNIHCAAFVDLTDPRQYRIVDAIASDVYDLAIALGGTLSGEHGDGFVRTPFLERLYGPEVYGLFRTVKETFDPHFILNPGKIIGDQNSTILHDLNLQ
ncbi:MAG: FAD-binding oxidoreductase [Ignavibacteriales bacterium]|nr:FAD-binding oxidoreductase [Ignavibacteriales bacterium]